MPRTKTLIELALGVRDGTVDAAKLDEKVRAKIRRLGTLAMGGESLKDSPRPSHHSSMPHAQLRRARAA
jgi:chromosome condensin MukBEF MukE localization factor